MISGSKVRSPRAYGLACGLFLAVILAQACPAEIPKALAQQEAGLTNSGTGVQTYENKNFDIRIEFTTDPDRPTISNYTMLDFRITHIDGTPVTNLVANLTEFTPGSNLTFTGSQYYAFNPANVTNGTLSETYFFPSSGLYRLLLRIAPNGELVDAPFSVYVHNPSYQAANDAAIYGGIAAAAAAGGVVVYLKSRKKK